MERGGCVYILTNKKNTVLYTGVTSDLQSRMYQHIHKTYPDSFSNRYKLYKLVYYAFLPNIEEAIAEEKRIKGGNRLNKITLIETLNPEWEDLYEKEVKFW